MISSSKVAVAVLVIALVPLTADADDDTKARMLYQAGTAYFQEGDYAAAQRQFERAFELSQRPQLLYNISVAAERAGNTATAVQALNEYLTNVRAKDAPSLQRRLNRLKGRLDVERTEAEQKQAEIERLRQDLAQAKSEPELQILPVVFKESRRRVPASAIASFSAAGVGALLGGTFGILALNKNRSMKDGCHQLGNCTESERDTLRRYSILADVGLGVTLVGAGLGTFFLVRDRKKASREKSNLEQELKLPKLSVTPSIGPTGAGLHASGTF